MNIEQPVCQRCMKLPQRCARYVTGDTSPVSPTYMSINWNFVSENEHFNGMSMQNTSAARIKRLSEECNKRNSLSDSLACPAVMAITAAVETASRGSSSENPLLRRPVSTESLFCDNNWNIDQMNLGFLFILRNSSTWVKRVCFVHKCWSKWF